MKKNEDYKSWGPEVTSLRKEGALHQVLSWRCNFFWISDLFIWPSNNLRSIALLISIGTTWRRPGFLQEHTEFFRSLSYKDTWNTLVELELSSCFSDRWCLPWMASNKVLHFYFWHILSWFLHRVKSVCDRGQLSVFHITICFPALCVKETIFLFCIVLASLLRISWL